MNTALKLLNLAVDAGHAVPGLVSVSKWTTLDRIDEKVAVRQAASIGDIDYVFFRRFSDGRSSQVAAYIIDNSNERMDEAQLAKIHKDLWLNGSAPLLYVGWKTRVDVLACAAGPSFWRNDRCVYSPAEMIETTVDVSRSLQIQERQRRFSAFRLSNGTFWDDPDNAGLADVEKAAHRRLIDAVVEADRELGGEKKPVLRRLLLLMVLVKYLEDRKVFPPDGWFDQCHKGANSFFDVLRHGSPEEVLELLSKLERKFNGDVFALPENNQNRLTKQELRRFAELIEAKTLQAQRYLWEQYSFRHIPVEVLSHLYQHFAQRGKGAVFTPPFVASLMLDYALPYEQLTGTERILDPTCGSGVFLVGAFRRLVHFWQSRNGWRQPDVVTLKTILKRSIFGVELQEEAAHLTAFGLALAICDALQPNVIWKELRFDKLVGANLLTGDFFARLDKVRSSGGKEGYSAVVGNPPFQSKLSDAAKHIRGADPSTAPVPDNQMAYLIAEQAMGLLEDGGRMCLIQPSGFLYNEKAQPFRKAFITANQVEAILDFTSIRKLYDGADKQTLALLVTRRRPANAHNIDHLTFRRTFSVQERICFDLDHYDRHVVSQKAAENYTWTWRANLLGGGRLHQMALRLSEMGTLCKFIEERGWSHGEGLIVGKTGKRVSAPWLTGRPLLPTDALSSDGIDAQKITTVEDIRFSATRTEARYTPPLVLIKELDSLPCAFWDRGFLAFRHQIISIHAPRSDAEQLQQFCAEFTANRPTLRAFCALFGTRAFSGKATSILKRDIDVLPWPRNGARWDLSRWEKILCDDIVEHTAEFIRLGQNSRLLKQRVSATDLKDYATVFTEMLGSVYTNIQAAKAGAFDGIAYQAFCFGKAPDLAWPEDWTERLREVIYIQHGEALRMVRVLRFYESNTIVIVKPDRLRYWIRSTAIRDADETVVDLRNQGY